MVLTPSFKLFLVFREVCLGLSELLLWKRPFKAMGMIAASQCCSDHVSDSYNPKPKVASLILAANPDLPGIWELPFLLLIELMNL